MTVDKLFRLYGRNIYLCSLDEAWKSETFSAFLQPLRYKNKMYLNDAHIDAGISDMGYYLYIGPANHDLTALSAANRFLCDGTEKFALTRAEKVYFGNNVLYFWAIFRVVTEV